MMPELNQPRPPYHSEDFFSMISGSVKFRLFQSMIELNLPEMLFKHEYLEEDKLIKLLKCKPIRAKKWLSILEREHFLEVLPHPDRNYYNLGPLSKKIFGANNEHWQSCKVIFERWKVLEQENITEFLQGAKPSTHYPWPPNSQKSIESLEMRMQYSSEEPIQALEEIVHFSGLVNLLDVGGGNGTIPCYFAQKHKHLKAWIYNLPDSKSVVMNHILAHDLSDRVQFIPGNFLTDKSFPNQYNMILFSRLLWDWSASTVSKLLKMAHQALTEDGLVIICEGFQEDCEGFTLAWEYQYLFWQDFERKCFKSSDEYIKLLNDAGFELVEKKHQLKNSMFSVLKARKRPEISESPTVSF